MPRFLGMGYGNSNYILGTPVHSIPATFLFEFGILGSILFLLYLIPLLRRSPHSFYFLLVPFAIYGISIIGISTSFFLFTLGVLAGSGQHERITAISVSDPSRQSGSSA